jgi:hypothetical protein
MFKNSRVVESAFKSIKFPINNSQLATAMLLADLLLDKNRLLCQMGAGKGKSRVVLALAIHHLRTKKEEIFVIFSSDGLRKRDLDLMADIHTFVGCTDSDFNKRVKFVVGLDQIPKKKGCLVIVDESDYIIMKDPVDFFLKTSNMNAKVVCLTATPDDGEVGSLEHELMKLLGYHKVLTEETGQESVPVVDNYRKMGALHQVKETIEEFR